MRIIISAVLLCLTVALAFFLRKSKSNPSSVFKKALFRIKSVRFFPVAALVHTFFALVILFFGLQVVEVASGLEYYSRENIIKILMTYAKFTDQFAYPMVAISGRERVGPKEKPRILVVGDSFVWGQGLTNVNQIWWNIMASELEHRGYDCEVYAVGEPGASTWDELLWLKDTSMLEDIQPDLIVIGYVTNDPDLASMDSSMAIGASPMTGLGKTFLENISWLRPIFPGLYDYLNGILVVSINSDESNNTFETWEDRLVERENLENYYAYVLQPLSEFMQELGIPLIVIPTPTGDPVSSYSHKYGAVFPLFEQVGLPIYNPPGRLFEQLADEKYKAYLFANRMDNHPGPLPSWLTGQYAADVLEQGYASIIGKKENRDTSKLLVEINDWMPSWLDPQAVRESGGVSQYTIQYPSQSSEAPFVIANGGAYLCDNFLRFRSAKKYVQLNFKHPVRLSSVTIAGSDLQSAEVYTLAINEDLGFDDQNPVSLGKRRGSSCEWADGSGRYVTSLLLSAKTKDRDWASFTVTIESDGGQEAFY